MVASSECLPHQPILDWYAASARDLPWRAPGTSAWGVLVSEVMLQQTPVSRVLPAYAAWLDRWPTPGHCAAAPAGEAVRQWGRLGYPRRALRLHAAAVAICDRHGGEVPDEVGELLALPGIGAYTARAVASFAFGQRHPVVDTNVLRVLTRAVRGRSAASGARAADLVELESLLPVEPTRAVTFSVAVMELGALVCTARSPGCETCPLAATCAWRAAGAPEDDGVRRRSQAWDGTDRQVRGRLMAVLRAAHGAVTAEDLLVPWPDDDQRARALASLVHDGLVVDIGLGTYTLPG